MAILNFAVGSEAQYRLETASYEVSSCSKQYQSSDARTVKCVAWRLCRSSVNIMSICNERLFRISEKEETLYSPALCAASAGESFCHSETTPVVLTYNPMAAPEWLHASVIEFGLPGAAAGSFDAAA